MQRHVEGRAEGCDGREESQSERASAKPHRNEERKRLFRAGWSTELAPGGSDRPEELLIRRVSHLGSAPELAHQSAESLASDVGPVFEVLAHALGRTARDATGGVGGVDLVVETMGPDTIEQSMRAVGSHGQIMLLIARGKERPDIHISAASYGMTVATIRRLFVGSRASFQAMNRAIAVGGIRPIIDRTFAFSEVHDAYRY